MRRKTTAGFTLMELLIAVAIMLIISGVSLSSFWQSQKKSRDTQRKSELAQVARALELYNEDFGEYPEDSSGLILGCQDAAGGEMVTCGWEAEFKAYPRGVEAIYMKELPDDPSNNSNYYYKKTSDGFLLYSALENDQDAAYNEDGWDAGGSGPAGECGSECRYKLSQAGVIYPD